MVATKEIIKSGIGIIFLLVLPFWSMSQDSFLSQKITLEIPKCSLEVALQEIGKACQFRFSYDADLIPFNRQVSLKANNTEVRELLKELLGKEIRPVEIGNHVILMRSRSVTHEIKPFPNIVVTGIILDAFDRDPLKDVTIFEVDDKRSAISDGDGNYKLLISTGKKVRSLTFCKSGYADTIIFINQTIECKLDVRLRPLDERLLRISPISRLIVINSIDSLGFVTRIVPKVTKINAQNLEVRTSRTLQAAIIPFLSTNRKVTGSITNRVSFNLLAGYTGGLKGFELGGLLNISRNEIKGFQIGGLGNIVGGNGKGLQIGSLFNFDMGTFKGAQIAGLFNYVPDTVNGLQISLATNIVTEKSNCWQVSLLLNLARKEVRHAQLCGLVNYERNVNGVQLAGLINIARNHNDGVQICGLMNYATIVNGPQIGIINISNTVERGVPIGLFNYVKEGYHLFEISGNEIFFGNIAFKSGTKTFYNFLQVGMGSDYKLQCSYGIGTLVALKQKLSMTLDASAGFVYHPTNTIYHGLLLKFNPAVEYRFAKHFAIFLGPAYNFFLFTKGKPSATPRGISNYDFYFKSTPNASIQMWIGGVVGVRF